jgi:CDP-diacylglycerol--glycerol-3-phosphate 3-phosphatidyltransferase
MKQLTIENHCKNLSMNDQWWIALVVAVMLVVFGYTLISVVLPSISSLRWALQAVPVIIYILITLQRRLGLNRRCHDGQLSASLGAANWITLARGGLIAMLAGFWRQPWPGQFDATEWARWLPGIIFISAALGDALDGWVARLTDNRTLLGIYLDTRIDALGILVASLVGVGYGQLPKYYICAGLAWYLLRLAVLLRKKSGRRCGKVKARRGARLMAGLQMAFLSIALLPVLSPSVTHTAAVLILIPFLAGFLVDWQMVCHHEDSN